MSYRDNINDQTFRLLEQTQKQVAAGLFPKINTPTIDVAKKSLPTIDPAAKINAQLSKQAADIIETATKANPQLWESMGARLSAKTALEDLFPGPGATQALANLNRTFQPPAIGDYLAKNNVTSIFSFNEPTIAEQLGTRIDTKTLMGLTGLADTAGKIAEQWRLASTGALSNFGESFNSLGAALNFEQALNSSRLAQAVLAEARKLDEEEARRWAEAELTDEAETGVDARLTAEPGLAEVVGVVQRYFVVYLGYTPIEAHNLVRRIVWAVLFIGVFYAHSQVGNQLNDTVELGLSMAAPAAIGKTARKTADALIPDGKPDTSS